MARVVFTANLQRHVPSPPTEVPSTTVHEVLEAVFATNPLLRSYVLDDQGTLRKHMSIFVNGDQLHDRQSQSDAVNPDDEIYVMQALSGG